MTREEIRGVLEKQLQLLSEYSEEACCDAAELSQLSSAMLEIATALLSAS